MNDGSYYNFLLTQREPLVTAWSFHENWTPELILLYEDDSWGSWTFIVNVWKLENVYVFSQLTSDHFSIISA